jgi:hypothetical protein
MISEDNKKEAINFVKDEVKGEIQDTVKEEVSDAVTEAVTDAVTDTVSDTAGDLVGDAIPFGGGIVRVISWPIRAIFKKKKKK